MRKRTGRHTEADGGVCHTSVTAFGNSSRALACPAPRTGGCLRKTSLRAAKYHTLFPEIKLGTKLAKSRSFLGDEKVQSVSSALIETCAKLPRIPNEAAAQTSWQPQRAGYYALIKTCQRRQGSSALIKTRQRGCIEPQPRQ
jgi:hypothetical protein